MKKVGAEKEIRGEEGRGREGDRARRRCLCIKSDFQIARNFT